MSVIILQKKGTEHSDWVKKDILQTYGSDKILVHGQLFNPCDYPGIVASIKDENVGLLIYRFFGEECEILSVHSYIENMGIGTALIESIKHEAVQRNWKRVWLTVTNDNVKAIRFYQKRGFDMVKLHNHSVAEVRKMKPELPLIGMDGIPIKHEIEFEFFPDLDSEHH